MVGASSPSGVQSHAMLSSGLRALPNYPGIAWDFEVKSFDTSFRPVNGTKLDCSAYN